MSHGFIGLGSMGGNMSMHLINNGYDLTVYDVDQAAMEALKKQGANAAATARDLAEEAETVFMSLPNPNTVERVVFGDDGIISGIDQGNTLVDTTTSVPKTTQKIDQSLSKKGAHILDAGVTRGVTGAREGNLAVMVGGDGAVLENVRPQLETFAGDITHVGETPGMGHAMKLLTNYIWTASLISTCEAVSLGEKYGLDPRTMIDVFNDGAGRNAVTEETFPKQVLTGKRTTEFPMQLWDKDMRLFAEFSEDNDAPLIFASVARQIAGQAKAIFGDDADVTRMYDFVENVIGKKENNDIDASEPISSND